MRRLRKFVGLSPADRWLLLKAGVLLSLVRVGTWGLPFRAVRRITSRLGRPNGRLDNSPTERIAWAVDVAGKYIPDGRNCLVQALTMHVLLERRGRPSRLRIGVAKGPSGDLKAHAWVESEGKVVIGGREPELARFVAFPDLQGERM